MSAHDETETSNLGLRRYGFVYGIADLAHRTREVIQIINAIPGEKLVIIYVAYEFGRRFDVSAQGQVAQHSGDKALFIKEIAEVLALGDCTILVRAKTGEVQSVDRNGSYIEAPVENVYGLSMTFGNWGEVSPQGLGSFDGLDAVFGNPDAPDPVFNFCWLPWKPDSPSYDVD